MKRGFVLSFVFLLFASIFFISLISADFFGSWFDENSGIKITGQVTGNAVASSCVDSDNGKNYFAKGTTSGIDAKTGSQTTQSDRCVNRRTLIEYFCDNDGKVAGYFNACFSGCSAGVCRGTAPRTTTTATAPPTGTTTSAAVNPSFMFNFNVESITQDSVNLIASTADISTIQVEYGQTSSYGLLTPFDSNANIHVIRLSNLIPDTIYYYRFKARDLNGNIVSTSEMKSFKTSLPFTPAGECTSLLISGLPEDKINIVAIPDGYLTDDEINKFVSTLKEYFGLTGTNGLFNIEPFKSYKSKFNVYYVSEKISLGCSPGGDNCDEDKVRRLKSLCPLANEEIIIYNPNLYGLHNNGAATGGHSLYAIGGSQGNPVQLQGLSLTTYQVFYPNTLAHEFGHSFGSLKDLYGTPDFLPIDSNWPNVDVFGCPKWCNGSPIIPEPNNQGCSNLFTSDSCTSATFSPGCEWIGSRCIPLRFTGNVGSQCNPGYGCYQGAEGLAGYGSSLGENSLMGNHVAPTGNFDPASYDHLVSLLNKNKQEIYSIRVIKTCEQTRTLKRQASLNRCAADEQRDSATMRAYSQCRRTFFGRCISRTTYYDYNCVKTTQTQCSVDAVCLQGMVEKSSVAC